MPDLIGHLFFHPHLHRQAGGLCGARGLRSALGRSTPSSPLSGSSAERTASQRVPPTHMPWAAIPVGHHTDLPPAVIPIDSIIPGSPTRHDQPPSRHARPDRASLSLIAPPIPAELFYTHCHPERSEGSIKRILTLVMPGLTGHLCTAKTGHFICFLSIG